MKGATTLSSEAIDALRERLVGEVRAIDGRVMSQCPLDRYVQALEAYPAIVRLGHVSPEIRRRCETIRGLIGDAGLELYHQALLLTLMGRARGLVAANLPQDIKLSYEESFQRIFRMIKGHTHTPGFYLHPRFCKDLGLCTLRFIPAGVQIVHLYRLPRRLFVKGGPGQVVAWVSFVARMRGLQPIYEMHTHSDDLQALRQFHPEGWKQFYQRMAELLRRNPRVKGVMGGGSWLFDPALEQVSPELSYVRTMVTDNGGRLFRTGVCNADGIRDATLYSPHRRRLYEEGTYRPMGYLVVWPRKELIAWAERG